MSGASDGGDGTLPIWTLTLHRNDQVDAFAAVGDPAPSRARWDTIEPVASIPTAVLHPGHALTAGDASGELTTLNAYSRMVVLRSDPPAVVIANDGVRYPEIDDGVLVRVARSLHAVPTTGLSSGVSKLPVSDGPTTTFVGTTTTP